MDVSTLELFVAVVRQGSFAAVARDHNIDPSSVSRSIASLENELNSRLFHRTTRRLSLTEAGNVYFEQVASVVEALQQAQLSAQDAAHQPQGNLRVTASVSFGLECLVPLLPDFSAKYPNLNLDLLLTDAVVDLLSEQIDVAIRLGRLAESSLIAQRLIPVRYRVCASPDYLVKAGTPTQPEEMSRLDCLRFSLPGFSSRWIFAQENQRIEVPVQGQIVISNAIALRDCAIQGMGIALLPHWLTDKSIQQGHLIDLFPNWKVTATDFDTAAWMVHPSRAYIPKKTVVFMDYLKQSKLFQQLSSPDTLL